MGGEVKVATPPPTQEEIFARLIEIGKNAKVSEPHTVWVVESPPVSGRLFYQDRSDVDNICHAMPVSHFEAYPFSPLHLESASIAFYAYKDHEFAIADAVARLAQVGRRCRFCHGAVHAATGCQYTKTFVVCGTCIQPYQDVTGRLPKAGLPGYLEIWTCSKGKRGLKRFPDAQSFYECAGKFREQ